jgi:hypothetical protein
MRLNHLLILALCGCSPADAEIRSEIGNGALRPAKIYPDEEITLTIRRTQGDPSAQMSIVIKPDRTLRVEKYDWNFSSERTDLVTHTLDNQHVSKRILRDLYTRLAPYRPEQLTEEGATLSPKDCNITSHGSSIVSVGFKDSNDKIGVFVLQKGCAGQSAARIESDLKQILSKLPELDVIKGYGWGES